MPAKKAAKSRKAQESREVEIWVCPNCGSTNLTSPSTASYSPHALLVPGFNELRGLRECVDCGFAGYPALVRKKIKVPFEAGQNAIEKSVLHRIKTSFLQIFGR